MDYYDENDKKTTSVLQSDEMFSSRILARQSTIGSCSSRIYYRPASEGVPFQWEKQPGKPIAPQPDDVLPPLSPPPAVLAMGFPKPLFDVEVDNGEKEAKRSRRWSKAWVVKNIKKKLDVPKILANYYSKRIWNAQEVGKFGSERNYCESARFSSASFASATSNSSSINYSFSDKHPSRKDHQSKELSKEKPFTCNPRGFSAVVVYFVKRS